MDVEIYFLDTVCNEQSPIITFYPKFDRVALGGLLKPLAADGLCNLVGSTTDVPSSCP